MNYKIENEFLEVEISTFGAELQKIVNKKLDRNYLWNGEEEFWGRRSPVLFPFVGSLKNKQYEYKGKRYSMGQHGFARDMNFEFLSQNKSSIWFVLKSSKETLEKYPFEFILKIGYELNQNEIKVMWKVENIGSEKMYFSIGAHPAFLVPIQPNTLREEYFLKFDTQNNLKNTGLENGLANRENKQNGIIELDKGYLKISKELFKYDALIIEHNQTQKVSLCLPDKTEYVTLEFDSPLFGVWSPYKENVPFVCIEPWYGRCDDKNFEGTLENRLWQNELESNGEFYKEYKIILN